MMSLLFKKKFARNNIKTILFNLNKRDCDCDKHLLSCRRFYSNRIITVDNVAARKQNGKEKYSAR